MNDNNKISKMIDYHQGCVEYYAKKIIVVESRIEKGKVSGADKPEHEFHHLFQSLLSDLENLKICQEKEKQKVKDLFDENK